MLKLIIFIFISISDISANCENLIGQYHCKGNNEKIDISSNGNHLIISGVQRAYQEIILNAETNITVEAQGAVRLYSTGYCTTSGEIILEINGTQDFHSLLGQVGGIIRLTASGSNLSMTSQFKSIYAVYEELEPFDISDFIDERGRWRNLANANGVRILPSSSSRCEKITHLSKLD